MKYYSVVAVVCSRRGTYDAELQFKTETGLDDQPQYISKFIEGGFFDRTIAKARAEREAEHVQGIIESHVRDYLKKYPDAKE